MNTNWIGVAFVSEEVPNREQVEDQLAERTEALRQEAQTALDAWLNEQGLEQVMGVIIPKKNYLSQSRRNKRGYFNYRDGGRTGQ